jgi:hypothetical protein
MSETTDTNLGADLDAPLAAPLGSPSGASLGFPLKGTLRRSPFPKLVRQLARTKSTGSLYLLNGNTKKVVFFDRGEPISVRSNVTAECLGQILAREGLITQAQCDQTLESIRRTGKKQGELLIEMGILSEGNLRYGLEAQLRHKLFDIFAWDDGRYQYKPDIAGDDYGLRFNTDAQGLILTALLETSDEPRAAAALEPYLDRFPVIDADQDIRLDLTPEERYFLACLDGSRDIGELLTAADPPVPSAALLLYAAIQSGIAKLAKTQRQPRSRPTPPTDGRTRPDAELEPGYAPHLTITSYEDTPVPGQLPKAPDVEIDDDFDEAELPPSQREVDSALVAAERDTPDETFDEDLVLSDDALLDEPGDSTPAGAILVADPADSGMFAKVPLDDDDDEQASPASAESFDRAASSPGFDQATSSPGFDQATSSPGFEPDPTLDLEDELEEIEELEELDELDELDEPSETDDVAEPVAAALEPPAADELAADDELPPADDLVALAAELDDLDDDLALDGALAALDDDVPLEALAESLDESLTADDDLALDPADELVALDDLDDLDDLELGLDGAPEPDAEPELPLGDFDPDSTAEADVETMAALYFADGETAVAERRWADAIAQLEAAYENGVDVAELHVLLAWSRFQASGESPEMADHALELLAYAQEMNPNLAAVHAYRGAVLLALGDAHGAQDAAQLALDIDPYDELAIDVLDRLG